MSNAEKTNKYFRDQGFTTDYTDLMARADAVDATAAQLRKDMPKPPIREVIQNGFNATVLKGLARESVRTGLPRWEKPKGRGIEVFVPPTKSVPFQAETPDAYVDPLARTMTDPNSFEKVAAADKARAHYLQTLRDIRLVKEAQSRVRLFRSRIQDNEEARKTGSMRNVRPVVRPSVSGRK